MFWMWEDDDIYDFFPKLKYQKYVYEILNSSLDIMLISYMWKWLK